MISPAVALEAWLLPLVTGEPAPIHLTTLDMGPLALGVFGVVAPVEEVLKFVAAWLAVGRHPEYDEPVDGVVYMAAAGLGFSTAENVYYISALGPTELAARGVFSCFLHASCSGLVGYWWSEVRWRRRGHVAMVSALAAAILAHGLFDLVAFGAPGNAFLVLALFLTALDLALMARISDALDRSPHRPEAPPDIDALAD
jgi:RsiW-degrading membrane proteinase PrsW (M82 family)